MRYFKVNNIILALLIVLVINNFIGWFIPKGMTNEEHELQLKLHDLKNANFVLQESNERLQSKINTFKDEILKNDSIIDNSNINELDSMFTDYFSR